MIIPASAGMLGLVFSLLSLIPWMVFVALLMMNFRRFASESTYYPYVSFDRLKITMFLPSVYVYRLY